MSEINTVFISSLLTLDGKLLDEVDWKIGDMVRFLYSSSTGTIVRKTSDNHVEVLWGKYPQFIVGEPGYFVMPGELKFVSVNLCVEGKT